jgi:SnoaL-like domain
VLSSWRSILLSTDRPYIVCQQPYATVAGDHGRVLCVELVGSVTLAATNHFRRIDGAWRLVHHQSTPIAPIVSEAPRDTPIPPRRVH